MIKGLDVFKEYFSDFKEQYVKNNRYYQYRYNRYAEENLYSRLSAFIE